MDYANIDDVSTKAVIATITYGITATSLLESITWGLILRVCIYSNTLPADNNPSIAMAAGRILFGKMSTAIVAVPWGTKKNTKIAVSIQVHLSIDLRASTHAIAMSAM